LLLFRAAIAVLGDGKHKTIILDPHYDQSVLKSYVFYDEDKKQLDFGMEAMKKGSTKPGFCVHDVKRIICTDSTHSTPIKFPGVDVVYDDDDTPSFVFADGTKMTAITIYKKLFEHFIEQTYATLAKEGYPRATITDAFITVPAHMNGIGRKATKQAAEEACLTVSRLMAEPTAASVKVVKVASASLL
jgi:molecular chaperone DnaK (HSP70)